jgi:hypothetical protein
MLFAQADSPWNSLEVVKLFVGVLSPAALLVFGLWLNRQLKRFELLQWSSQKVRSWAELSGQDAKTLPFWQARHRLRPMSEKVIERRLAVFQELAPLLNDLLCYFTYIGCWKELTPLEVVKLKRRIDKSVYVNAPLFPSSFIVRYNALIHECYSMFTGWGEDAKLRTQRQRRKQAAGSSWDQAWDACFVPENEATEPKRIREVYSEFMSYFAQELGVGVQAETVPAGHPPANIL